GTRFGVEYVSLVDGPRPREGVIGDRHLVMQYPWIDFVAVDALLENRLVVDVQRQAGLVDRARALEAARLHHKHVIDAVAVLVDPSADRVAGIARLDILGPIASVGEDSTVVVVPAN